MSETRAFPWASIVAIILVTAAAAGFGGLVSSGSDDAWYEGLNRAPLNPPDIAFAIVWPILYMLMAAGAILVRLSAPAAGSVRAALGLYGLQLVPNAAWSWAFFGAHAPGLAMTILVTLWLLIAAMIVAFAHRSKLAALLQVPYLGWVSFAGYLNGWIVAMN